MVINSLPHNRVGIIASRTEIARRFFDELIGNMRYKDVQSVIRQPHLFYARLTDETEYFVLSTIESARGRRFSDLYIQDGDWLSVDNFEVLLMTTVAHTDGSAPSIDYFGVDDEG